LGLNPHNGTLAGMQIFDRRRWAAREDDSSKRVCEQHG
jgi:hypothetical protein